MSVEGEAIAALRLFNEKATLLNSRKFLESMRAGKGSFSMTWKHGAGTNITPDFPHEEERDAYLLSFRLFLLSRDDISFARIVRHYRRLFERGSIPRGLLDDAAAIAAQIEAYLDGLSTVVWHLEQVRRRTILEVCLYGGLAHANPEKRTRFVEWMSDPIMAVIFESEFLTIITVMTQGIFNMRHVNLAALKHMEAA